MVIINVFTKYIFPLRQQKIAAQKYSESFLWTYASKKDLFFNYLVTCILEKPCFLPTRPLNPCYATSEFSLEKVFLWESVEQPIRTIAPLQFNSVFTHLFKLLYSWNLFLDFYLPLFNSQHIVSKENHPPSNTNWWVKFFIWCHQHTLKPGGIKPIRFF